MSDLPPLALACALELVGAVREQDPDMVAHTLRNAAATDGLDALAVCLAAMVDDTRTLSELLAWTDQHPDTEAWRRSLTDDDCRRYRNAWGRGDRAPDVVDGYREFERRRVRKVRRTTSRRLRSAA